MSIQPLQPGALLRRQADGSYRYRIRHVLGIGGFAITYRAEDALLHSDVAIKEFALDGFVFRRNTNTSLDAVHGKEREVQRWLEKFLHESRRLSAFRHPRIVRVTDVWTDENQTAYYSMDLIEGTELPAHTVDGSPSRVVPLADVQRIALDLLDALDAVHEQRLVHCDLKPSNVLLTGRGEVVLIDFGAARAEDEIRRTVTSNAYTPVFASPELQDRKRLSEVGPWTDLYGWAATVAACLVPLPASGGVGIDGVTRRIVWDTSRSDPWDALWPSLAATGLPDGWVHALRHCLQIAPTERPTSAREVLQRLRAATTQPTINSSQPVETRPIAPQEFTRPQTAPLQTAAPASAPIAYPVETPTSPAPLSGTADTVRTVLQGALQLVKAIALVVLIGFGLLLALGIFGALFLDSSTSRPSAVASPPVVSPSPPETAPATPPIADVPTPTNSAVPQATPSAPPAPAPVVEPANVRPTGSARLYGEWRADIAAMLSQEAANMAPEELAMMQALMGSMEITFTFRSDGSATMAMEGMGQAEVKDGRFEILSSASDSVRFRLTEEHVGGEAPAPETFTARFTGAEAMSLTKEGDPQVIPFVRARTAD